MAPLKLGRTPAPQENDEPKTTARPSRLREMTRRLLGSLFGKKDGPSLEAEPNWSLTIKGASGSVQIERQRGSGAFWIRCTPAGYVSKQIFVSAEEADGIEQALSTLEPDELAALAKTLAYSDEDDRRIEDPNGAGKYMKQSLLKYSVSAE